MGQSGVVVQAWFLGITNINLRVPPMPNISLKVVGTPDRKVIVRIVHVARFAKKLMSIFAIIQYGRKVEPSVGATKILLALVVQQKILLYSEGSKI